MLISNNEFVLLQDFGDQLSQVSGWWSLGLPCRELQQWANTVVQKLRNLLSRGFTGGHNRSARVSGFVNLWEEVESGWPSGEFCISAYLHRWSIALSSVAEGGSRCCIGWLDHSRGADSGMFCLAVCEPL